MRPGRCASARRRRASPQRFDETRDVSAFTKIESGGSADITVTIGEKQSLTIEADDNILPLIETKVNGDKLTIGSHDSYSPKTDIKITITVPALDSASVHGSVIVSNLRRGMPSSRWRPQSTRSAASVFARNS